MRSSSGTGIEEHPPWRLGTIILPSTVPGLMMDFDSTEWCQGAMRVNEVKEWVLIGGISKNIIIVRYFSHTHNEGIENVCQLPFPGTTLVEPSESFIVGTSIVSPNITLCM